MKAVGYTKLGALEEDGALVDFKAEKPSAKGHDLLVAVKAISVNPVDYKIRNRRPPEGEQPNILGWDAVGEVVAVGDAVTAYKPGDAVWYAGAIDRPGTNAEFHLVDERIVGRKPSSVPAAEAAALPLTSLTAHEML
ncbi:MAG: alcohol dehydrogenase catalytic domain-containing protein, partial [Pseudomonadota bacterium]